MIEVCGDLLAFCGLFPLRKIWKIAPEGAENVSLKPKAAGSKPSPSSDRPRMHRLFLQLQFSASSAHTSIKLTFDWRVHSGGVIPDGVL